MDIMLPITSYPIQKGQHQKLVSGASLQVAGSINALISAQRLGANVAAIGYLGSDHPDADPSDRILSFYVRDILNRARIDSSAVRADSNASVPTCAAIFDPSGSHTFLASNEEPPPGPIKIPDEILPTPIARVVKNSQSLIVDGYALNSDSGLVSSCARLALSYGKQLWFDPQAAITSHLQTNNALFLFLLRNATGMSLTFSEAAILTGENKLDKMIHSLSKKHCPDALMFLIKNGEKGSYTATRNSRDTDCEIFSTPGFPLTSDLYLDSIGAGDSFLGAFLAGLVCKGFSLRCSSMLANAMGAATCAKHGAGISGVGTIDDVLQVFKSASSIAAQNEHISNAVILALENDKDDSSLQQ